MSFLSDELKEKAAVVPLEMYLMMRAVVEIYMYMLEDGLEDEDIYKKAIAKYQSKPKEETLQ